MTPTWLLDAVAAVMLAVAAVSAVRLVASRRGRPVPWRRGPVVGGPVVGGPVVGGTVVTDTDVAHLLMALAMAGMLAPRLRTLPDTAWEVAFGLLAAWFAARVARDARVNGVRALAVGHCAPHLVHCCSMTYMFAAMSAADGGAAGMAAMGGMPAAGAATVSLRYPALALAFALGLAGYCIWDLDQLSGRRYSLATPHVSLAAMAAPRVAVPGVPVLASTESRPASVPPGGSGAARDSAAPQAPGSSPAAAGPEAGAPPGMKGGPAAPAPDGGRAFLLSPAVTIACRVAMGIAMAFMLVIAI